MLSAFIAVATVGYFSGAIFTKLDLLSKQKKYGMVTVFGKLYIIKPLRTERVEETSND